MSTEFHIRVQRILDQTLAAQPPHRDAVLRAACAGDERLLRESLSLLPFYASAGDCEPTLPVELQLVLPATTTMLAMRREAHQQTEGESLAAPFSLDQYTILNCLGAGGMGVVYRAVQAVSGREVAIKIMRRRLQTIEEEQRFVFEGEVLRQMQHPGIARFRHSGIATLHPRVAGRRIVEQRPYFVMEYIHGVPITWFAEHHKLDAIERLDLLIHVCEAIEYAHYRGIVHCDLKPDNILVDADGQTKVVDFGIARFTDWEHTRGSIRERAAGTRAYASPEQALGQIDAIGPASDVFSLGIIAHELFTGRRPNRAGFSIEIDLRGLRNLPRAELQQTKILEYYLRDILAAALRLPHARSLRNGGELLASLRAARSHMARLNRPSLLDFIRRAPQSLSTALTTNLQRPLQAVIRARIVREAQHAAPPDSKPKRPRNNPPLA